VVISLGLSRPARTEVSITTLSGRVVRVVEARGEEGQSGFNVVRLPIRSGKGAIFAPGTYLVRVRAIDSEGCVVRAVTVLMVR